MGQLIQQFGPDLYKVWSTNVDDYICEGTAAQIEERFVSRAAVAERKRIRDALVDAADPKNSAGWTSVDQPPFIKALKEGERAPIPPGLMILDDAQLELLEHVPASTSSNTFLSEVEVFQDLEWMAKLGYVADVGPKKEWSRPQHYRRTALGDARVAQKDPP